MNNIFKICILFIYCFDNFRDITSIIIMRLSQLVRRSVVEPPLRKKITGVNMQNRKELRRIRKLNIFSRQLTGEQNEHGWFTPRRFKALGIYLQTCRNAHPGTLPIKPQLKKEIGEKFVQDSHWSYYVFRNYLTQIQVQEQIKKRTVNDDQISQLPAHFRDEFKKEQTLEPLPKLANPFFIYNAQYNVFLPQDQRQRINLLFKLENPPENKDEEQRKEAKQKEKQE